jgi:hypothetical protein
MDYSDLHLPQLQDAAEGGIKVISKTADIEKSEG